VPFLRCFRRNASPVSNPSIKTFDVTCRRAGSTTALALLLALPCLAQGQSPSENPDSPPQPQTQAAIKPAPLTIPAGTLISLVLTHSIQSRYIHRGDDIYAQITFPVDSGNQVVIPAGTFVQGVVDRLDQRQGRAELHLQSMSITFPDGYVTPIAGAVTLETAQGYALKDPGGRRFGTALGMVGAGAGIGALIGHSVGSSSSTVTATLPPGCTGPPPGCLSSSVPGPGRKGFDTGVGLTVGGAIGGLSAFALLASSRHFFVDVGTPVDLTLQQPVTLQGDEVAAAVRQSTQQGVSVQPVFPRPLPPLPPDTGPPIPTSPGTPPTIIPGPPGPGGMPGAPIIIPGTPPGA
jgi:hypothetical protein